MVKRTIETTLLPVCIEHGVATLSYSSLSLGLLTGRIGPDRTFTGDDQRKDNPLFSVRNREKIAAFAEDLDAVVETEDWGAVRYDLCFGGVFYALVDVDQLGLRIEPQAARALAEAGVRLNESINARRRIRHPETPEIEGLAYVMFRSAEPDGALRTCTTLKPGRVDRSPCGTGSSANVAARHARASIKVGDTQVSRSIIGSEIVTTLHGTTEVAGRSATLSSVTGSAWIYALSQIGLDPSDLFPEGFRLSDTWGGV